MENLNNDNVKQLQEQLDEANRKQSERFKNAPDGMNYIEFERYMSVTSNKVDELDRKIRLIKEPNFSDLSSHNGDVMSLNEFIECVKSGGFIDYDGSGNYVRGDQMSDISIYPSDFKNNSIRTDFDTIIWFNR